MTHKNLIIKGIPASPGIALGPAFIIEKEELQIERYQIEDAAAELGRLDGALQTALTQIEALRVKAEQETGPEEAAIFEAHALILRDPALIKAVREIVEGQAINLEAAWQESVEHFAQQMEALEDEYFRARAADVRDVGERVLRLLLNKTTEGAHSLPGPCIVVAKDLTPSDTVNLDKTLVLGFCTAEGGPTSHTAILAKALGLPAVVGVGKRVLALTEDTMLILDGEAGEVTVDPDQASYDAGMKRQTQAAERSAQEKDAAQQPAVTRDGHPIEVVANIGSADEAALALEYGAEGVGLLRTEFLYLDRKVAPSEEQQFQVYTAIMEVMEERPVVVRTLDVGGDKELPYLDLGVEANPFLGWRAIRMCLDRPDFFKTQLRALLRVSPGHDLRIMFPMVATLEEVQQAKQLISEAQAELDAQGQEVGDYQLGIMVEVPSVAVLADQFARQVNFFSIGTNDLTQYTFAADRTNEKLAHLADACHPAILRQIERVIQAAHKEDTWVGLCGELAGDPDAVPILLGLGLDEFSMAPASIPRAKAIIRGWSLPEAQKLAAEALTLDSGRAVRELVRASGK